VCCGALALVVIILTRVSGIKMEMEIRTDLGQGLMVCCCECGDELPGCIKIWYFLAG